LPFPVALFSFIGIKMNCLSLANNEASDFLVDSTARYKILCNQLNRNESIPDVMWFVGFTDNNAADRAFQM
jgi:hypothetical protein